MHGPYEQHWSYGETDNSDDGEDGELYNCNHRHLNLIRLNKMMKKIDWLIDDDELNVDFFSSQVL